MNHKSIIKKMEQKALEQLREDEDYYEPRGAAWIVIVVCVLAIALFAAFQ